MLTHHGPVTINIRRLESEPWEHYLWFLNRVCRVTVSEPAGYQLPRITSYQTELTGWTNSATVYIPANRLPTCTAAVTG